MELSAAPADDVRDLGPTPPLDGLRGVAILAVLATHVAFLDDGSSRFALRGGYLGVDVFMVLSSFLIGTVLLRSLAGGGLDGPGFARRRLRRLWPALLIFLAIETPVALWFGEGLGRQVTQVGLAASFTFNWQWTFGDIPPFALVHLWSLAVEAQFYVLLAVGLVLARRHLHRTRLLVVALLVGAVLVAAWRWWLAARGVPQGELYVRTDTRADSMLLGLAAAVVWRHRLLPERVVPVLAAVAAVFLGLCFLFVPVDADWLYRGGFTLVAAAAALIVAGVATGGTWAARASGVAWLRWVGARSYSLYLWHLPIYIWFVEVVPDAPVGVTAPLAVACSFLVAIASFRWIESRALAPWRAAE
jgi:peptidoglycan/LPS O-acetylase OafA/YrhL